MMPMIRNIRVKNFKCLRRIELEMKAVTVLAGRNGSGKSSLVQALMCLDELKSEGGRIDFKRLGLGTLQDVYYRFNQSADRQVVLELDGAAYAFDYDESQAGKDRIVMQIVREGVNGENESGGVAGMRCLLADRLGPRTMHDVSGVDIEERQVGLHGENAVAYLHRHMMDSVLPTMVIRNAKSGSDAPTLANQVSAWLQRFAEDVSVVTDDIGNGGHVRLAFEFGDRLQRAQFNPENVGVGFSRVLPALVLLLTARRGDLLVIENPEMDLHPRGQTELTSLMAAAAKSGVQLIVETHSDHIVNGLRLSVKNGDLPHEDVKFAFFKRIVDRVVHEQFSDIRGLDVDAAGELSDYPKDFLDEWGRTLDRLLDLTVTSRSGESEDSSDDSES